MKTWKEIIHLEFSSSFPLLPFRDEQEKLEMLISCYRLGLLVCYPIKVEDIDYFNAKELLNCSVLAVVDNDIGFIKALLEYQTRKRFIWYILDMLIQCAIDNQKHEIQVMLVDYKYRNDLFKKKAFEL